MWELFRLPPRDVAIELLRSTGPDMPHPRSPGTRQRKRRKLARQKGGA